MDRRFAILDVFSEQPLAGNQLAVVLDGEGLSDPQMQAIAAEFGFSETTFMTGAETTPDAVGLRIFTPKNELPFAGHPTVGSAIIAGLEAGLDDVGQGHVVLHEKVGAVRCAVAYAPDKAVRAEFDLPVIARPTEFETRVETAARALGLAEEDIGFENHVISAFDGGVPYTMVPLRSLGAVQKAVPSADMVVWRTAFGTGSHNCAYLYCRETVGKNASFHTRMFAPDAGILEDAATGSAAASFAGAIMTFDKPADGTHHFVLEQGIEMGRPSMIELALDVEGGEMKGGRIGGPAVIVARGVLSV